MLPIFPSVVISIDTAVFSLIRIAFLIGFGLYVAFAFIAVRQIEIMRKTVETPLSGVIRLVGYAHLIAAAIIFAFVFMTLR